MKKITIRTINTKKMVESVLIGLGLGAGAIFAFGMSATVAAGGALAVIIGSFCFERDSHFPKITMTIPDEAEVENHCGGLVQVEDVPEVQPVKAAEPVEEKPGLARKAAGLAAQVALAAVQKEWERKSGRI